MLITGGEALARAARAAGCQVLVTCACAPLEPWQEDLAQGLAQAGGAAMAAASPGEAVDLALGAAMTGAKVMLAGDSSTVSGMQEGLSRAAGQELPLVLAHTMQAGPGAGNPLASQGDLLLATHGGGHGDHRALVLAPATPGELAGLAGRAFALARRYRVLATLLLDRRLAEAQEEVEPPSPAEPPPSPESMDPADWALGGAAGRPPRVLASALSQPKRLEALNHKLFRKQEAIARRETRWREQALASALMVVVAYGPAAEVARQALARVEPLGVRAGLLRPVTLWPFPHAPLAELARRVKHFLVLELNSGQMLAQVERAVAGRAQVHFHGRPGGAWPSPDEVAHQISRHYYAAGLDQLPASGSRARP